jgi:hypothetical protein
MMNGEGKQEKEVRCAAPHMWLKRVEGKRASIVWQWNGRQKSQFLLLTIPINLLFFFYMECSRI